MNDFIRILLIEDNPGDVRLIRELLPKEKGGSFRLESVDRLSAGVERLASGNIDVILLDLGLPDSQGFDTFIKVHNSVPQIPIVVLSGLSDETLAARAVREGAQDYLVKGHVDSNLLWRSLRYAIERKQAEEDLKKKNEEIHNMTQQLLQTEKLATMGELSASIAHELNNPLATVNLRLETLLSQIPPEDPKRRSLEVIEKELDRMANLVANLLQFSRRSQQRISTVDVCQEINNTLDLILFHLRKYGIQVQREFLPDIPYVHADRQQLRQLFLNLFTNSSDAMPQGGTLTIRVYRQEAEAKDRRVENEAGNDGRGTKDEGRRKDSEILNSKPGTRPDAVGMGVTTGNKSDPKGKAFVVIEIADTGIGISSDFLPNKVMEPFFTTKPEGKGTGLGLPICRRIVQEHNGTFEIFSEGVPGRGTTVHIALPVKNGLNVEKL